MIQKLRPVFFGECGTKAQQLSGLGGETFPTLRDAITALQGIAQAGDTVLLSPGGTSLDEFRNFEERGTFFAEAVRKTFPFSTS